MIHTPDDAHLPALRRAPAAASAFAPPAAARPLSEQMQEPAITLLEVLLRHKGRLIACVVVALALGVVYQLLAPRKYDSTAEVYIQNSKESKNENPLLSGGVGAGQPSTQASLIRSTPVLAAASRNPALADLETLAGVDDPVQYLRKNIEVGFSKERETLTVSIRTGVPEDSAALVNAVIDAYLHTQEANIRVMESGSLEASPDSAAPGNAPAQGVMSDKLAAARLMLLSDELTRALVAQQSAANRFAEGQNVAGDLTRLSALVDAAGLVSGSHGMTEVAYLRAEQARVEQQLNAMPPSWGEEHQLKGPLMRQAEALQEKIAAVREDSSIKMLSLLAGQQEQTERRVAELSDQMQAEQIIAARVAQLPVMVIERAQVPVKKAAPKGVKSLGVALFLGLMVGVLWTLYLELSRTSPGGLGTSAGAAATSSRELTVSAGRSLSEMPAAAALSLNLLEGEEVTEELRETGTPLLGQVPEVPTSRRLASPEFDATASSIHQIRAMLQIQAAQKGTRAFAFTSPRRGAGKTSMTIGVASSLAVSGTRTLVVDCDLAGRIARGQNGNVATSRPTALDPFGPIDPEGSAAENSSLDNVVRDHGFIDEHHSAQLADSQDHNNLGITGLLEGRPLRECLVPATVPGLSLLPAANATTRHIGLMSDAFIRQLIADARNHFDLILFDTGPIPGSVEALLVTSQVDGVILVVPQGESRANLNRTMSYLKVVGANIVGTVFNKASDRRPAGHAASERREPAQDHAAEQGRRADPIACLELEQALQEDDGEYLSADSAMGSGILAAAVFSNADSGFANENWKLKETSASIGSVDELFGPVEEDEEADDTRRA